ncbi:IclR family transcriptional regulator [Haloarcula hispanica]|nr:MULTISPECIES: IclR family transcriptional regulator [Haloarcula]AJF27650.1 transcriptional regulator [Haloarcula sp. CBA1115]EMA18150.1 transcription regulator [Haloarcula amylolytica JCM 13557]KAA9404378.1 IclR family transcriptional regulator [Haloarcula sp. CBA1131]KAA9404756.1 IclR family transcriptional regulator [Haloarcula hispanica]KZX46556.1 transcriptional regulator [Haloarcula sp. K1]
MTEREPPTATRQIKSIQTASDILREIQSQSEVTLADLCDDVDVAKSTLHTYLQTLVAEGFIDKSDGVYRLGLRFVPLGESVRNRVDLYQIGKEEVERLAEETSEWVHLTVAYRNREVTLYEHNGGETVAMDYQRRTRESPQYLHCTATGKALLAHFDEAQVTDILASEELVQQTEKTITDPDELRERLAEIRRKGYAINDEEEIRGMRSVGAPIQDVDGAVCGAISVTAPKMRLSGEYLNSDLPELVMEAANIIEVNLESAAARSK